MLALMDEQVLECIRPVSEELVAVVSDAVTEVTLRIRRGPAGREAEVQLEVHAAAPVDTPCPVASEALDQAARRLAAAWLAVGQGMPTLLFVCVRQTDGSWTTNLSGEP